VRSHSPHRPRDAPGRYSASGCRGAHSVAAVFPKFSPIPTITEREIGSNIFLIDFDG
jgi:hypothetical protein